MEEPPLTPLIIIIIVVILALFGLIRSAYGWIDNLEPRYDNRQIYKDLK